MKSCIEFVTLARKHNHAAINARIDGDTIKRENAVFYRDTCMKSAREARAAQRVKARLWLRQEDDELEQREKARPEADQPPAAVSNYDPVFEEIIGGIYKVIGALVFFATFVVTWWWCIEEYGFLLGVGVGWFPSLIVAAIVGMLWLPLAILVLWLAHKAGLF